jgi:hypothetical protein
MRPQLPLLLPCLSSQIFSSQRGILAGRVKLDFVVPIAGINQLSEPPVERINRLRIESMRTRIDGEVGGDIQNPPSTIEAIERMQHVRKINFDHERLLLPLLKRIAGRRQGRGQSQAPGRGMNDAQHPSGCMTRSAPTTKI